MGVQQSLLDKFTTATSSNSTTRFLVVKIQNEQAIIHHEQPSQGSVEADFGLIDVAPTEACYILYALGNGKGWCFITYVSSSTTGSISGGGV